VLRAFFHPSSLLSTLRARYFVANAYSFMRAAMAWVMAYSSSKSSLGGSTFLVAIFADAAAFATVIDRYFDRWIDRSMYPSIDLLIV
jgi:4-hydroxybenzoate polyprenyltransferase